MFNKKRTDDNNETNPKQTTTEAANPTSRVKPLSSPSQAAPVPASTKSPFPLAKEPENTKPEEKGSRLHVGKDIHLKGEITACDRLIVEGKVEASMNSNEIEITQSGIFNGEVIIDTADISGEFEGTLTARTKLIIRKTGRVSGSIEYGEIEIEPGGEISGHLCKTGTAKSDLSLSKKVIANKMKEPQTAPTAHH
ncbi:bactofilin family protein [Sneathiella aquimaris]|uniref:bactofilin family protein n=1 Tax=Sneathiella aquimaris TaxID=2599305 RepID=UPI00146BE1B9|nr:polymer-forming cytoskeletal protein [Sneathiella aquimaris]